MKSKKYLPSAIQSLALRLSSSGIHARTSSPDATGKVGADVEMDDGIAARLSSLPHILETAL